MRKIGHSVEVDSQCRIVRRNGEVMGNAYGIGIGYDYPALDS